MRSVNFFKYFHYSFLFGIFGTFASFLIIGFVTYCLNYIGLFGVYFSLIQILLLASVLSATDTLAPLALISEDKQAKLFSLLFGEGVFNDAFSIVLFQILTTYYTRLTKTQMMIYFAVLFTASLILGILIGFTCSLFLKYLKKHLKLQRTQEISILLFFAFISYTSAQLIDLSPILTLLFT